MEASLDQQRAAGRLEMFTTADFTLMRREEHQGSPSLFREESSLAVKD